ncbi:Ophiobolin F synthase [Colletotrichum trifolii]|uniref:Ophiobolin F synthase n=1 Tax=Colletotrichum trifolii TaxID=5466 RepID=A0A4R8RPH1_COLTR|nr:Ophiobolin F synthase [Colletotrichum trifolii]
MGNIHDDLCDELPFEEALKEHSNLSQAMEVSNSDSRQCSKASDRSMKMKKYISKCLLEAMEIDRARALRMINSYRSKWLDVMESQNVNDMQTLEEYLVFRNLNGGMEAFWSMVEFGMAIDISESEKTETRPLFKAAESALVLTNDYWSWDREWRLAQRTQDPRIVNAVHLIMRTEGLSVDQAREKVRERIVDYEREYLRLKEEFYTQRPNLPLYLRRYVEVCGVITAGNHYWCANCPRHHAWRDEESSPSERSFSLSNEGIEDPRLSPGASTTSSMSQKSSPATEITLSDVLGFMAINDNHKPQRSSDMALMAPVRYIRSMPSKGLRSLMVEALDQWLLVDDPELEQINNIIDLLHNSSLILDDIEDDSPLRRGLSATHTVFGQAQSINSANFMFVQAVQMTQKLNNPASLDTLLDELECLFIGQSWDLYWKFHLQVPTEKEYLEMVDCKTGAMFRLLARLMFHESSVLDKRDGNINALLEAYSALLKTYTHDDKTFVGTYMVLLHLADVLAGKGMHVDTTGLGQATTTLGPSTKRQIFEIGGCKEYDVIGLRATLTSLLLIYGNTPPFEIWNLEQAIIAALKACKQDVIVGPIVPDRPIPGGPIIPVKPTPGGPIIPDQPVPGGPIVTQSPVPGGPIQPSD